MRQFTWAEVRCVWAWKLDCVVVDLIFLSFDLGQVTIDLHEELRGYTDLVRTMEIQLPDLRRDWWSVVAFPPFTTNRTVVWSRDGAHLSVASESSPQSS